MHFDERQATNPAAIEILEICDAGHYTSASGRRVSIAHAQQAAVGGTRYFSPEDGVAPAPGQPGSDGPRVEVIDATTQEASLQLADEGDVAALNFASARNPGGGFLGGARAQEEEVCRCSGLYRCLVTAPEYYTYHRAHRSLLYSDRMIYSPKVPFFRTAAKQPLLEEPFLVSVITAPAPNAGAIARNAPDDARHIAETLRRRW
ncbi:MAG: TIGR02452 family protein, partial [Acidobacteriota bacterium]